MHEAPPLPGDPPAPPFVYRDRRTGLVLFGVLEILIGVLCLLLAGFMVLGQIMMSHTTGTPLSLRLVLPSVLSYIIFAVGFVWLGIGSTQCRRWARALVLIVAWLWLAMGVLMVPMMAYLMPRILANPGPGGQSLPREAVVMIVVFQILFIGIFFILLPGTLLLFYRSPHVKSTCETRDPGPSWTDACPLPVLAIACLLYFGSAMMAVFPVTGFAIFPCFGTLVSGIPAIILMLGLAGPFFWIGRSCYRLNVAGWWALVILILTLSVSAVLTFARTDMVEMYEKMGYPQAQIDLIRQQGWMDSRFMMWMSLIWIVPMLAYLLWAKRYFAKGDKVIGARG